MNSEPIKPTSDGRPDGLIEHVNSEVESNDKTISDTLDELSKDALALKAKPTLLELVSRTGLSEGTIRKRKWALLRLKALKNEVKQKLNKSKSRKKQEENVASEKEISYEKRLEIRVNDLLKENAILFDEVIGLQEELTRRDRELKALNRRLSIKSEN